MVNLKSLCTKVSKFDVALAIQKDILWLKRKKRYFSIRGA